MLTSIQGKLPYMSTLQNRIAELMAATGLSVGEIAEIAGVSSSAVTQWKDGPTKSLKIEPAAKLANKTGFTAMWISTGQGPKSSAAHPHEALSSEVGEPINLKGMRRLPVVGEVKGGDDGYLDEFQYPVGYGDGYIEYPTTDPHAYALRVRGDSMHPRYRAGEYAIVEPSIEAQDGDDVLVICGNGKKMLKQLNWRRDGEVQLLSINNGYGPLTLPVTDVDSIQLVAGRARKNALHL